MNCLQSGLKKVFLTFACTSVVSCGGGGSETNTDSSVETNFTPPSQWSFPYEDTLSFRRHDTGELIALSDDSLWHITGSTSSGYDANAIHDITIYDNGSSFAAPSSGTQSQYFMYLEGSPRTYYVNPINGLTVVAKDTLDFQRETTKNLIGLSDGSLFFIKGTNSLRFAVNGVHNTNIYSGAGNLPVTNTFEGEKTNLFMHIQGSTRGFFLEPLSDVAIYASGTASFSRERNGDYIASQDGSLWHIKGIYPSSYDVTGIKNFVIYENIDSIPSPDSMSGNRGQYYMYIIGSSVGFFIDPA